MLEIRPNCECCDQTLAPNSVDAMICSYECTFCRSCVEQILENVCPNCGGGFTSRPVRPVTARRPGVSLSHHPASTTRVNTQYRLEELKGFAQSIKDIEPSQR